VGDDEVFPGISLDDLATAIAFPPLPSVAGAAPGIFGEFADAFSWAKGAVFDPIGAAVSGFGSEIVKYATQAVGGFFAIAGWWMYKFFDDLLGSSTSVAWRSLFPHPDLVKGLSPWYYLHKVWAMVWKGTANVVGDAAGWLGSQVRTVQDVLWLRAQEVGTWLWARTSAGIDALWLRAQEVGTWLWARTSAGIDALWLRAQEVGTWLWARTSAGIDTLWLRAQEVGTWLWARTSAGIDTLWLRAQEVGTWLWARTSAGFAAISNPVGDVADWLWDNVSAGFADVKAAVTGAVIAGGNAIGDVISDAFRNILLGPVDDIIDTVNAKLAIPGKLIRAEYRSLAELVDDISDPPPTVLSGLTGVLITPFVIAGLLTNLIFGLSGPLIEPVLQEQARNVGATLPPVSEIQDGWNRGVIGDAIAEDMLRRWGFGFEALEVVKELRHRLPTPSDLVRFGVREVFTPAIAEQFGQFLEFPPRFGDEMEKQGYTGEWSQAYWAAHWELPSVSAGYEMLHRDVIDLDTLNLLLRAQDVMPFWRQKLVDIAYNLPTRVDTRRLYKAGIWTEAQVYQNYLHLGNPPETARALTDFAIKWATPEDSMEIDDITDVATSEIRLAYRRHVVDRARALDMLVTSGVTAELAEFYLAVDDTRLARDPAAYADVDVRDLTLSVILDAYSEGLWDRDRTQRELESAGFLPTSADLLLTLEDYKIGRALTAAQVGLIRQQYIAYDLDGAGSGQALQLLEISPGRQSLILAEWSVDRQAGTRKLSVAEVRTAWRAQRFADDDALAYLLRLGYNADDADLIFASW